MRANGPGARAAILAVVFLAASACKDKPASDVLAQDTSLNRDLALANTDTMSQPQLTDVPANVTAAPPVVSPTRIVRSSTPAPAPRPVAKPKQEAPSPVLAPAASNVTSSGNTVAVGAQEVAQSTGTVSSGSTISLYSGQRVCTNTNAVGDRFTANVAEAIQGSNGVSIPAGATVILEITSLKRSGGPNDGIEVGLTPVSIGFDGRTYPLNSEVTYAQVDKVRDATRGDDAKKVATGAVLGAIAGQIFGHHTKSTVIGAAAGAAAGAIGAAVTAKVDGCVPSGGRITLRLNQAVLIPAT